MDVVASATGYHHRTVGKVIKFVTLVRPYKVPTRDLQGPYMVLELKMQL